MPKLAAEVILYEEPRTDLAPLVTPSGVTVTALGTTGATTYSYRVSAVNASGETLASAAVQTTAGNAALSAANFVRIRWNWVVGATSYRIYGRTAGDHQLMATVTASHWDDTGTAVPSGAVPASNTTGYRSDRLCMGPLMETYTSVSNPEGNFVGPMKIGVTRPLEMSTGVAMAFPCAIRATDNIDYVFLAENSTAATTRRVFMYEFNRLTSEFNWKGFITVTFPTATNHTVRGMKVFRYLYSTGTVSATGTAVTGVGTAWATARFAVGSRIGFGSTDPRFITNWYEISTITNDTSITLLSAVLATVPANTPFVIEEIRVALVTTNATAANGGLYLVKGVHPDQFSMAGGTAVPAATNTDNIRACYWLADSVTNNNTNAAGVDADDMSADYLTHNLYSLDGVSTIARIFVHNIRAALTVASGRSTNQLVLSTSNQGVTGNIQQNNNCVIYTAGHGPGSGVKCLYFVTTTRVVRVILSNITAASTTFVSDSMTEVPPGGTNTFAATGAMFCLEADETIDRFIITTSGANGIRSYVTQYQTSGAQFDHIFLSDNKQQDQSTADTSTYPFPNIVVSGFMVRAIGGVAYFVRATTVQATNQLYAVPTGAHWAYAGTTFNRIITPEIATAGCTRFYRVLQTRDAYVGAGELGVPSEPFRIYYRTSGISDNSGAWTLLSSPRDLSAVPAANSIQLMLEFRIFGPICVGARIHSVAVVYETGDDLPAEFEWNVSDSSTVDGTIGFTQVGKFYRTLPDLRIAYYRSDTNAVVTTQDSTGTTNGNFQYWDGGAWVNGVGTDTIGLRRRFVPAVGVSFPASVNVYAKIRTL